MNTVFISTPGIGMLWDLGAPQFPILVLDYRSEKEKALILSQTCYLVHGHKDGLRAQLKTSPQETFPVRNFCLFTVITLSCLRGELQHLSWLSEPVHQLLERLSVASTPFRLHSSSSLNDRQNQGQKTNAMSNPGTASSWFLETVIKASLPANIMRKPQISFPKWQ